MPDARRRGVRRRLLLRAGEYQLAPAGTQHERVSSDIGGILFAHGDIDLALLPQ